MNVDEISNKLDDQLEAMRWLVRTSGSAGRYPALDRLVQSRDHRRRRRRRQPRRRATASGRRCSTRRRSSGSRRSTWRHELNGPVVVTAAVSRECRRTHEERVVNASRMVEASLAAGIKLDRIFVDPLVFPIAVDGEYGRHCLDAIAELRRRFGTEIHITGGMSNVSFGLPNRRLLNDAFLLLAIEAGADSGIVDPTVVNVQRALAADRTTRPFQLALDVFTGVDENCRAYMKAYRAGELTPSAS